MVFFFIFSIVIETTLYCCCYLHDLDLYVHSFLCYSKPDTKWSMACVNTQTQNSCSCCIRSNYKDSHCMFLSDNLNTLPGESCINVDWALPYSWYVRFPYMTGTHKLFYTQFNYPITPFSPFFRLKIPNSNC